MTCILHKRSILVLTIAAVLSPLFDVARAEDFPSKPVRLIVPSPPGGGTDGLSRLLGNKLRETRQWQIVLDNRPGAGGNLGLELAAKAAPDGYTLAMGESSNLAINMYLYRNLPIDVARDIAPVALVGTVPLVLVVAPGRGFDSVQAIVATARKKQLVFASSGNGTVGHLVGEMWRRAAGIDLLHVPYKGAGPVMTDLMGGQVDLHFASLPAAVPLVRAGRLRALAVASPRRIPSLPDVPTLESFGYTDFDYHVFYGVVAPAATPRTPIERLNAAVNAAIETQELRTTLSDLGVAAQPGSPQQFGAFLAAERAKWAAAVKASGAKVD